jgi:hypothetical protein
LVEVRNLFDTGFRVSILLFRMQRAAFRPFR